MLTLAVGGVEGLRHRDEGDGVRVEQLDELGKVRQGAGEPVDLVDHHHIDASRLDLGKQPLQGRTLETAARDAGIVVGVGQQAPAFMGLALDVGFGGLALVVEGGEGLIEPVLGGFAGVDRAADLLAARGGARQAAPPSRMPKNAGPLRRLPVISRAITESER